MNGSFFSSIAEYVRAAMAGGKSVLRSGFVLLPYWLNRNPDELHKEVTEQYPDPVSARTPDDLPARSRGKLVNDVEKCTGCGDCVKVCPVKCIVLETEPGPDIGKEWISAFDVDYSKCLFCGLCAEVCVPQSLVHTKEYELSGRITGDMVGRFGRGRVTPQQRARWEVQRRQELEEGL